MAMLIVLQDVTKNLGDKRVLNNVTLSIAKGERLVLLGPSGCGKSTILRLIAGFLAPDGGQILLDGEVAAADGRIFKPPEARRLGMVFQDLALWPHLTVHGNLDFGLKARGIPRAERNRRIKDMLKLTGIEDYAERRPAELSGGEQQRVALARTLVLQPKALLMDEPLSSLDEQLGERLRREVIRLQQSLGFTLVYVTHNSGEAADIATRTVRIDESRIVASV